MTDIYKKWELAQKNRLVERKFKKLEAARLKREREIDAGAELNNYIYI